MTLPLGAERDRVLMAEAISLAAAADHRASPNPTVGALLTTPEGIVLGRGTSAPPGGPHAEIQALAEAGERSRGATLHVTLEPCSHHGRTGPCADALVDAGVARVVAAVVDPDPRVSGRGLARLRAAGIEVDIGVLADQASRLHRFFLTWMGRGRPFVTLKIAASLDGRVATSGGQSQWITSPESRALGHLLRHRHDAVLVGVGTVLADDPRLTARLPGRQDARQPVRAVADSRLRTPPASRLLTAAGPVVIGTLEGADPERRRRLEDAGATVVTLPGSERVDLASFLEHLGSRELSSVLVEGGPQIHGSLRDAGLADGLVAFLSPRIIGGTGAPAAIGGAGAPTLDAAGTLQEVEVTRAGGDIVVSGYFSSHTHAEGR